MSSTYRSFLRSATTIFVGIGLLAFIYILISSLSVDNSETNKYPHIDISKLDTGETIQYQLANHLILITKTDNDYSIVSFPGKNGTIYMPEFDWSRPVLPCNDFIQPDGFQCLDEYKYRDGVVWWNYMKWDKSGKYIGEYKSDRKIPDLMIPRYKIVGNNVVIYQL